MPGPNGIPTTVHLCWTKYADLLLFPRSAGQPKGVGVALSYSSADVEQLATRARHHHATILEGPVNRPWNICEVVIRDPDGYRLVFNGPIQSGEHRSFEDIAAGAATGFKV